MTGDPMLTATRSSLRTPRSAGIAGIAFSLLMFGIFVLIYLGAPSSTAGVDWYPEESRREAVALALTLVPFAGIAFLWFIGVIRDQIGEREDRFFATVFLGSGLLFIAMVFVGAAVIGGMLSDPAIAEGELPDRELWDLQRRISLTLINNYAIRMAAVFIISATTIGLRTGILPRWLVAFGLVSGVVLLLASTVSVWMNLLLPAWALVFSLDILIRNRSRERTVTARS